MELRDLWVNHQGGWKYKGPLMGGNLICATYAVGSRSASIIRNESVPHCVGMISMGLDDKEVHIIWGRAVSRCFW